ncbi:Protein of unknown function DUF2326 [Geobacter metallireducens RCH3]|uniref:DUF2326 domain-containing protein n=1 Tax=Geobacter metallireducens (strain ATCC 53774 / DSM 7210 / GS-15) TaxID=269799 RepID=Q39WT6_GEOMG|nr:DUF2326 domain-containing protein [Geobacter metallireducens]ABB31288.2 hypothetical protein, nonconserved putative heme-binding site [Geobacter metallireducens GS-15]EHP86536.1 Protein of unknown function DUF2326 [Geobacter metallireducens RCH3]
MKLIQLSANQKSFHSIPFNPDGLNLIVGDSSPDRQEGSSNGVGKTLALKLVHHCLGATLDHKLKASIPEWVFSLEFSIDGQDHLIERSADGKKLALDERKISHKKLLEWLNASGVFRLVPDLPGLTFRSLFTRFGRRHLKDCVDPIVTFKESDFDGLLRSLYLLGGDCHLVAAKKSHKNRIDELKKSLKTWDTDHVLRDMFRAGSQPKVRAEWLDKEILRIRADLAKFRVAEDYRAIEIETNSLTSDLREIEKQIAICGFQIDGINKALTNQPDISKDELIELYAGLQEVFRPEMLAHFEAVEAFHNSLSFNRKIRLEGDRARLAARVNDLESRRNAIGERRDQLLASLQGKRALDEYAALAQQLARYEGERERLGEFLDFANTLQKKVQNIKEDMVAEDRVAASYAESEPLMQADKNFSALAELLYPRTPAGIILEANTGDNQLRYNLTVEIDGDDSDGINAAKVVCFDWTILLNGANHNCGLLWHDNRLFAHMDPKPRAAWFTNAVATAAANGKQYVASINTENFEAMKEYLSDLEWEQLCQTIAVTLRGDKPENKLLGVQFGR